MVTNRIIFIGVFIIVLAEVTYVLFPFRDYIILSTDSKLNDAFGVPIKVIHGRPLIRYSDGSLISGWAKVCGGIAVGAVVILNMFIAFVIIRKFKSQSDKKP